jgi:hypothetical protein
MTTNNNSNNNNKTFDCVDMKNSIQSEILEERKTNKITATQQIKDALSTHPKLLEIYNRSLITKDQNKN